MIFKLRGNEYDNRVRRISLYRALKLSRIVLLVVLTLEFVLFTVKGIRTKDSLIVLLVVILGPTLLRWMLEAIVAKKDKNGEKKEDGVLPVLTQRYGYSDNEYFSYLITLMATVVLLVVWLDTAIRSKDPVDELYPFVSIVVGVVTYVVTSIVYRVVITKRLLDGKG